MQGVNIDASVTVLPISLGVGQGAAPCLSFGLILGRELLPDRLDDSDPSKRVRVITAVCGLLRPPKASPHRREVPVGLAEPTIPGPRTDPGTVGALTHG